ncbi:uncharacterized protein LOC143462062 [Clavelina lepadiformis]|uniref:uncharacterized protein LOC143462062 n=1 Tax=Clavelina lepadiformis TaxID=159417 RepID=UPI00404225C8
MTTAQVNNKCFGLKVRHVASLISKIRQVVTAARTPKIDAILKRKTNKGAINDQATRWGSTYLMLERLLELKPVLVDIVSLFDGQWNEVKQLEELLRHPFVTTKKLQASDLTPGSFFKEWKKLLFQFSHIGGNLADAIRTSMERREQALFANDVLLAAVYVDPMYRVILNDEQHSKGKATLLEIALSMKDHEERRLGKNLSQGGNQTNVGESANFSPTSEDEDFEKILDRQAKRRKIAAEATDGSALQRYKMDVINAYPIWKILIGPQKWLSWMQFPCTQIFCKKWRTQLQLCHQHK